MTSRLTRRVLRTDSRSGVLALAAALGLIASLTMSFFSSPATAAAVAVLGSTDNVAICHHDNGVKVYNFISPNVDSIVKSSGHDGHADDIIPSFLYDLGKGAGVQSYPGKNLALLSTLNNGCVPPPGGPGNPTHVTPGTVGVTPSVCRGTTPSTPSYTVPSTPGITYSPAAGGTATPGTTVDVTATANAGYVIDIGGVLSPSVVLHVSIPAAPNCTTTGGGGGGGGTTGSTPVADNNLGISKTGPGNAVPGDELVWNLAVTNTSGIAATGFTVTDALPAGLSYSLAEGTGFACNAVLQVISCVYSGSLAVGQTANIAVRALLDSTYTSVLVRNTAVVDPNRSDSNAGDNSSTADTNITVPEAPAVGGGTVGGGSTGGAAAPPPVVTPPASGGGGGGALPFTGGHTSLLLQTGLAMFLLGWYFVTVGRRRPEHAR